MLLHWMQTRWMTGLMTAPGWMGLLKPPEEEVAALFSGLVSADISGF